MLTVQFIQMPRHWGLRAAAGKMLKSFTTVYCASGRRFTVVLKTSGERRREYMYVPSRSSLCCLQQGCAAVWPDDQVSLPYSHWNLEPVFWAAEILLCFIQLPEWTQNCFGPWHRAPMRALLGSRARQEKYFATYLVLSHYACSETKR